MQNRKNRGVDLHGLFEKLSLKERQFLAREIAAFAEKSFARGYSHGFYHTAQKYNLACGKHKSQNDRDHMKVFRWRTKENQTKNLIQAPPLCPKFSGDKEPLLERAAAEATLSEFLQILFYEVTADLPRGFRGPQSNASGEEE